MIKKEHCRCLCESLIEKNRKIDIQTEIIIDLRKEITHLRYMLIARASEIETLKRLI